MWESYREKDKINEGMSRPPVFVRSLRQNLSQVSSHEGGRKLPAEKEKEKKSQSFSREPVTCQISLSLSPPQIYFETN